MRRPVREKGVRGARRAALLWALTVGLAASAVGPLQAQWLWPTAQFDNGRTGWNWGEYLLTPDTVSPATFGKKWTRALDGQVYGSPLYFAGWVYVATENNLIYALDAETGQDLWALPYNLGLPALRSQLSCGNITPNVGITGTPVLDLETFTLYAVGLTRSPLVYKLAAVDMFTGEPLPGFPVTIAPPVSPGITPANTSQRGALVLANGIVYVGFGGYFGDCGSYHGWVVGLDAYNPTTPQLYYRTPGTTTHRGSGVWAAGGLSADEYGFVYASTGNSFSAPAGGPDYSNAVLRLYPDLTFTGDPADFFVPSNWRALNSADADLGSSPAMLIPPQFGSITPSMVFITGKRGAGHLLNRDYLGGLGTGDGINREGIYSRQVYSSAFSTAAYYQDDAVGSILYLSGRGTHPGCVPNGSVAAMQLEVDADGNSSYRTLWCVGPGTAQSPVVTSYFGQGGVLWVVTSAGTLYAFNSVTGQPLYNSGQVAGDALGAARALGHFAVADGRVFVPTSANNFVAYGLR